MVKLSTDFLSRKDKGWFPLSLRKCYIKLAHVIKLDHNYLLNLLKNYNQKVHPDVKKQFFYLLKSPKTLSRKLVLE
jgi:hypothetical protein